MTMTIGKKLFAVFGLIIAITFMTGALAIHNVGKLGKGVQELGHHYARILALTGDINHLSSDMFSTNRGMLISTLFKEGDRVEANHSRYAEDLVQLREKASEIAAHTVDAQVRELAKNGVLDTLDQAAEDNATLYNLLKKGELEQAHSFYIEKVRPHASSLDEVATKLEQREAFLVAAKADEDSAIVVPARYISIVMISLSIAVGVVVVFVVRGINETLRTHITELRDGAEQVTHAAAQVAASSQALAQGASEQAASLEETSASAEEINSMAQKNTDNSRSTSELLSASHEKVSLTNRHLEEMEISMAAISNSSGQISKIIKVIDEIAFQTNILALNAAVEAARAGEAGMGFAVVADEVRSLAQRSAQAAKDTAALIEDSIAKSAEGKRKVEQVAAAIRAVTEDSARVKVMVDEVSLGSEEQSRGIDQIGKAIGLMEQITQNTAASAEEGAAAAEELNAQSELVREIVDRLQAMIDYGTAPASSVRLPSVRPPNLVKPLVAAKPGTCRRVPVSQQSVQTLAPPEEFPMETSFESF